MKNTSTIAAPACHRTSADLINLRIGHTRIRELGDELQSLIYPDSQNNILLVVGPTGVGKTTLCKYMVDEALKKHREQMDSDANLIPAVYIQAPVSGEREFSWRLFYERILEQLGGNRLDLNKYAFGINENTEMLERPKRRGRSTLAGLRKAVERALRERNTQFLVIDEAAHIIRQTRRNSMRVQLDTLKSLTNECGTQIVLVGSYDLYNLVSLSAQLARRTHVLHFERYRQDRPENIQAFTTCLRQFEAQLPHLWQDELRQHAQALMENTLGCIGTLSGVLTRAAKLAEAKGKWSIEALQRALLTQAQVHQILEEITDGEAAIDPSLTRTMSTLNQRKHA